MCAAVDSTTGPGGHTVEGGCAHENECRFFQAISGSPVLKVRFVSMRHYCRGGDFAQCARFRVYATGGSPLDNLLPTGDLDASVTGVPTRVLVVDDVPVFRKLMEGMVGKSVEGAEIIPADNGSHALNVLARNQVDLVVTDFNMPGMDGDELLAKIRETPTTRSVPVIVLSTETEPAKRERCLVHDRVRWVQKSPDHAEFERAVRALLVEGRC